MINQVQEHLKTVENFTGQDSEAIEAFRIKYSGKKGVLADLFAAFREVPPEEKRIWAAVESTKTSGWR